MNIEKRQLLNELRILFFQQISTVEANLHYELFVDAFLSIVKERLGLKEIAYFKYDEWKQQFYLDATTKATTEEIQRSIVTISDVLMDQFNSSEGDSYFLCNHPFVEFQDYQAIISFGLEQKVFGLVAFKEEIPRTFSPEQKEEWFTFFKE